MKKLLLLVFCIFTVSCYSQKRFKNKTEKYIRHIEVDKVLQPYFDDLVHLYNINEVFIDYTKIKKIRTHNGIMVDSNGNVLAGYYDEDSVIWVKISHPTAVNFGIYDQILMAIIAHEIGHSQGFEHVGDEDADNLMYEGNGPVYDNLILKKKTLTEILLSPYKKQ
jgi:hypothetical protein